jgi:putative zinc finger protein
MMDCKHLREILDLYVDGELSPEATLQAEAHLAECHACRRAADGLQGLRQAIKAAVSQYQPAPQLANCVRKSTLSRWRRRPAWALAAVTAALFIVALAASAPQLRGAVANTLEAAAFHLDDSRSVVMEGMLLCRDCQLKKEYGYRAMCPLKGHHGTLQTKDGKIWNILDGDASEDLIHNSALLGRTVRIHGRCFRRASSIEVDSYEVL